MQWNEQLVMSGLASTKLHSCTERLQCNNIPGVKDDATKDLAARQKQIRVPSYPQDIGQAFGLSPHQRRTVSAAVS